MDTKEILNYVLNVIHKNPINMLQYSIYYCNMSIIKGNTVIFYHITSPIPKQAKNKSIIIGKTVIFQQKQPCLLYHNKNSCKQIISKKPISITNIFHTNQITNRKPSGIISGGTITFTQNNNNTPSNTHNKNKKYALLVGISDYLHINDLSYCDEDIISWGYYLKGLNYNMTFLGDKTSSYTPFILNGHAFESNIREQMRVIASKILPGDQFVFVSSGHGNGDGKGNSYLCCLDECCLPQGEYADKELATDIKMFTDRGATVIIFLDDCFSGGMLMEACACDNNKVCATSTCTENGYGFDVAHFGHGAWTYYFLIKTLHDPQMKNKTMIDNFHKAKSIYPYKGGNLPQIMGNGKLMF